MKAWVFVRINENGLVVICDFVISNVKIGIFFKFFFFLIGSRFRAFRLGPEGGRLDGACGAGPGPGKKTRLVNRPGSSRGSGYRKTWPEPDRLPFLLVGLDVS